MHIALEAINGISARIEFVVADIEIPHNAIIIDILVIRIVVAWT